MEDFKQIANENDIELDVHYINGLFGFSFTNDPKQQQFNEFFHLMLEHGVYLAPSAFEAGFVSIVHTQQILNETKNAAKQCFAKLTATITA